jgi:hypothetical protein
MGENDTSYNSVFDNQSMASSQDTKIQPTFISDMVHPRGIPVQPKPAHRSNTLMRNVVSKPNLKTEPKISGQSMLMTEPATVIEPKLSIAAIDPIRERRAKLNSQSELISRFRSTSLVDQQETMIKTEIEQYEPELVEPAPEPIEPRADQPSKSFIEKSLESAPTYEVPKIQKKYKAKKSRVKKVMSYALVTSLLITLGGGIFAYKNFNRIGFYVASSQAGFHASFPGYNPSGYTMNGVSSAAGIIQSNFKSNSDSRNYNLNEKPSRWTSDDLLNNYVSGISQSSYQTVNSGGKTIYLYGNGNATWVNSGLWYVITSNNSLSDKQLIQIASTT